MPFDFRTFLQSPEGCPAIPRITAVLGPSFGDAALHAAIADLVVMKRDAAIALSGPPVILGAIGEEISDEELGGPAVAHETIAAARTWSSTRRARRSTRSSASSPTCPTRPTCPRRWRRRADPSATPRSCSTLVPIQPRRGYDMRKVLQAIVDADSLFEWGERYGRSLITRAGADRRPARSGSSPASRCSGRACWTCRR